MTRLKEKKQINGLALLLAATYMVSYMTRINYGAVISEIEAVTGISRALLSMAVTGSFITYGAGQIVSGLFGDMFSPKKLVSYGLITSALMNFLIPVCKSPYVMLIVWCINGFAQSFMWPPIVKMMTALLSEEDYKRTTVKVSWGSSFGTIAIYLISPLIISMFGWRAVFLFSAICGTVMIFVWNRFSYDIDADKSTAVRKFKKSETNTFLTPVMICIMAAIILQGMLRDGVTTWMPSYIAQTYNMSNIISILTGVVLPIFSILCFQLASMLYRKTFTNPMMCAGMIFLAGTVSAFALFMISGRNAALSVLLSALLTGCMHGVNLILICMIPSFFKKTGNVSTVSGVLNSCTYVGSAISTYGIASLSEKIGWEFTLFTWILISGAGTVFCLCSVRPWKKRMD
ncbi:MAG: MFS transporter [Clostridia bacterium]|nr:MFS transporter [Clostridia bacterium]